MLMMTAKISSKVTPSKVFKIRARVRGDALRFPSISCDTCPLVSPAPRPRLFCDIFLRARILRRDFGLIRTFIFDIVHRSIKKAFWQL